MVNDVQDVPLSDKLSSSVWWYSKKTGTEVGTWCEIGYCSWSFSNSLPYFYWWGTTEAYQVCHIWLLLACFGQAWCNHAYWESQWNLEHQFGAAQSQEWDQGGIFCCIGGRLHLLLKLWTFRHSFERANLNFEMRVILNCWGLSQRIDCTQPEI